MASYKGYVSVTGDPKATQTAGDWVVRIGGKGPGSRVVSHHRLKSAAIDAAKTEARKLSRKHGGATLYIGKKRGRGRGRYISYGDRRDS